MGVKGGFASIFSEKKEARALRDVWHELREKDSTLMPFIVVDGMNFLMCLAGRVEGSELPRLQELNDLLRCTLTAILKACPDASLHFVFDGLRDEEGYETKASETSRRRVKALAETAEAVATLQQLGFSRRGGAVRATLPLMALLKEVVGSLPGTGTHRIFRAQSRVTDPDVAVALYATQHRAVLLLSDDSDFIVSFEGCILLGRSFEFCPEPDGLKAKTLSVSDRCHILGVGSMDELRIYACRAGTDLTPSVESGPDEPGCLGEQPLWREVVADLREYADADLFFRQYDLSSYTEDVANTWRYGGELACGLTSMVPPGDLDPLAEELCNEVNGRPADGADGLLATARLFRAFCHGHLSSQTLNLLRRQRAFTSCEPADFVMYTGTSGRDSRPVHDLSKAWIARVAALFLGKPGGDSWEDEDQDRDLRFQQVVLEGVSTAALQQAWKLGREIASAEKEAHECRRQHMEDMEQKYAHASKEEQLKERRQKLGLELLDQLGGKHLGGMTDVEKMKLTEEQEPLTAAKLPQWFWDDHDDSDTLRARQFFYMVTGHELPEDYLELVRQVITHKDVGEAVMNHHLLFILALITICRDVSDVVSGSHLEEMLAHLPRQQVEGLRKLLPRSKPPQISSRLVLGGLSWRLLSWLQEAFCLTGGDGPLFRRHLQLDGGPVLLEGKAKSYRVRVRGLGRNQTVCEEDVATVERMLVEVGGQATKDGAVTLRVTHMSEKDVLKFQRRLVVIRASPLVLEVYRLSY